MSPTPEAANPREVRFLDDVKVLELSNMAPNQLAMHLADLGAEVVKIETPRRGDATRLIGKVPGFNDSMLHRRWNRGKKSVAVDTNTPAGLDILRELIRQVDIVVEGFRPGTLQRMGLSWDDVVELNPDIVMVALSGYGQEGPYRDMGSHGIGFDAIAGLVPVEEDERGQPRVVTRHVNMGTLLAPLFGATAALAALAWARRTGEPVFLDVAQADAAAFANIGIEGAVAQQRAVAAGTVVPPAAATPTGQSAPRPTMQCYRTRDGKMLLMMALERKFFSRMATAVGRPDLLDHFPEDQYLIQGNAAVDDALVEIMAGRDLAEWMQLFAEVDVPVVPVNDTGDVMDDAQMSAHLRWFPADQGTVTMGSPVHSSPPAATPDPAAAAIGRDTVEVLAALGLTPARIDELERDGIVRIARPDDARPDDARPEGAR